MHALVLVLATLATAAPAPASGDARTTSVREYLQSLDDSVMFGLVEETKASGTRFRFIEGDRRNKAHHAFPLRVYVTVLRNPGKLKPAVSVKAVKEGIAIKTRNREAQKRWEKRIKDHLQSTRR